MKVFYEETVADRIINAVDLATKNAKKISSIELSSSDIDKLARWIDRYQKPGFYVGYSSVAWLGQSREFEFMGVLIKEVKEMKDV